MTKFAPALRTFRRRIGLAAALLAGTAFAAPEAPAPVVAFAAGAQAPWQAFVGDKQNWAIPAPGDVTTVDEVVTVAVQDDGAHRISWRGRAEGQYFLAGDPVDMTELVDAAAGLVIVLAVHDAPSRDVTLRMGCGYPCMANANITRLLQALPENEWVRVSVDAQCFANNGLFAGNVDMPFMLNTRGRMELSIADVRLEPGAGENAIIRC